ncbi:MAG: hypothetical protein ACFB0C_15560 [Leptolyngbyaceae cyanobacterium]
MRIVALVAQTPEPAPSAQAGVYLSPELLIVGGGGALLTAGFALIKWFVSREFNRFVSKDNDLEGRLKVVESVQAEGRLVAGNVERMTPRIEALESQRADISLLQQRFEAMTIAFQDMQRNFQGYQTEHMNLRAELNREYVAREDWIRTVSKLESILEAVHRRLDKHGVPNHD